MRERRSGREAAVWPTVDNSMSRVYRVSKGQEVGEVVASIKAVEAFARDHGPGRYHVDEIGQMPFRVDIPREDGAL